MKRILLLLLLTASVAQAGTYTAKTANYTDVNACLGNKSQCGSCVADDPSGEVGPACDMAATTALSAGDTLKMPNTAALTNGMADWGTNTLNIAQPIKLIGVGMDETHDPPNPTNSTIIKLSNASGGINATYVNSNSYSARISSFVIELSQASAGNYSLEVDGKAYRHKVLGNVVGGLRVDHIRWRNDLIPGVAPRTYSIGVGNTYNTNSFITGSFDHNFVDFTPGTISQEIHNYGSPGAPAQGSPPYATAPDGPPCTAAIRDNCLPNSFGEYQAMQNYSHGGGDDTELNAFYFEDNIFHNNGRSLGSGLTGGGRFVCRHNTSWGQFTGHGVDSGGNLSCVSWEIYNNWFDYTHGTQGTATANRGGTYVCFNNRGIWDSSQDQFMAVQSYRPDGEPSQVFGPATGRNFFDENWRIPLTHAEVSTIPAGVTMTPTRIPADDRIGSVYGTGTISALSQGTVKTPPGCTEYNTVEITPNPVPSPAPVTDQYQMFIILDTTAIPPTSPEDQGEQQSSPGANQCFGMIGNNNAMSAGKILCTNVTGPANGCKGFVVGHSYELRRVKTYYSQAGAGKTIATNGGRNGGGSTLQPNIAGNSEQSGYAFQVPNANGKYKYWSNIAGFGCYQWENRSRSTPTGNFPNLETKDGTARVSLIAPGGVHNVRPTYRKNDGFGLQGGDDYPQIASPSAAYKKIGAEWDAPGYGTLGANPKEHLDAGDTDGLTNTTVWGAAYPNAMVGPTPAPTPAISSASSPPSPFKVGTFSAFHVTTANFTSAPTITASPSPFPTGVILNTGAGCSTPQTVTAGTAWICGTPAGGTDSPVAYPFILTAHLASPSETATQSFSLKIDASNSAPSVVINSPADGTTIGIAPQNITINATATDSDGNITKFEFYQRTHGGGSFALIPGSVTTVSPASTVNTSFTWNAVAAGNYDLMVQAYDDTTGSTQSDPVQAIVTPPSTVAPSPTAAAISIRP